jgi:Uma2 family endonuclease
MQPNLPSRRIVQYEFVDGHWEAKETDSSRHSGVGTRLFIRLGSYVETNQLGGVYGADATFQIGKNERLPDVSFLSAARISEEGETDEKWPVAPDLAVELISPNELWGKLKKKLREYSRRACSKSGSSRGKNGKSKSTTRPRKSPC